MNIWRLFVGPQPAHELCLKRPETILPPAMPDLPAYAGTWGALALQAQAGEDGPDTERSSEAFSGIYDVTPTDVTFDLPASSVPPMPETLVPESLEKHFRK